MLLPDPVLDTLPDKLAPLRDYARRLQVEGEFDFERAIAQLTAEDIAALRSVGTTMVSEGLSDYILFKFEKMYPMTKYRESGWLYFLLGVMDELGIKFS